MKINTMKKHCSCFNDYGCRIVKIIQFAVIKTLISSCRLIVCVLLNSVLLVGSVAAQSDHDHVHGNTMSAMDHSAHRQMANAAPMAETLGIDVNFELLSANGEKVRLEDYRGQYLLVGFGFTHCDYVCPTMAANMAGVLNAVSKPATGIFVSVDTERDTPAIINQYVKGFHPRMVGLGGSYEQVAAAANNFKVTFAVTKTQKSYTVLHTASVYLIDPQGKLVDIFALNATRESIIAAMQ